MPSPLFYLFAILMIAGGVCVVSMKNPVSSAMGMIGSFIGIAALLIGLNAYFVGTLQVLVYAGAIMVLFIFIIMLLDLKKEERREFNYATLAAGIAVPLLLVLIMVPILNSVEKNFTKLDGPALVAAEKQLPKGPKEISEDSIIRKSLLGVKNIKDAKGNPTAPNPHKASLPDVNLIGHKLYTEFNLPLQIVGVLLLVSTIGCVALSKKLHGDEAPVGDSRMAKTIAKSDKIPTVIAAKKSAQTKVETAAKPKVTEVPVKQSKPNPLPKTASIDEKRGLIYSERPEEADDLTAIKGVGPVLEKKLHGFGIFTYKQVLDWSPHNIAIFDDLLSFKGRIARDNWLNQAKDLHDKKSS